MKKISQLLIALFMLIGLSACSPKNDSNTTPSSKEQLVELIVKLDNEEISEKVTFEDGETVMDVLKENYKVKENKGFITEIDGVSQDEAAGKYWMFDVNDKTAPKAANQIKLKDGDKVEFYQQVFD